MPRTREEAAASPEEIARSYVCRRYAGSLEGAHGDDATRNGVLASAVSQTSLTRRHGGTARLRRVHRQKVVCAIGLTACLMLVGRGPFAAPSTVKPRDGAVALLANGRLVEMSLETGTITASVLLAPGLHASLDGRLLAIAPSRRTLYALLPPSAGPDSQQQVAVVDLDRMQIRRRIDLPAGPTFRAILFGAATGHVYVVGDRSPRGVSREGREVVAAVFDPKTTQPVQFVTIREARGRNWSVFDGAIDRHERYVYVSYHGSCTPPAVQMCTTGADWFAIAGSTLLPCPEKADLQSGCLSDVHGRVEAIDGNVLATTGDGPLIRIDRSDQIVRKWRTGIPRTHLMEFAVSPRGDRAYLIGSCAYAGGLSSVVLKTAKIQVRGYSVQGRPSRASLCGDRVAAGRFRLLIAKNVTPEQTLLVADARTLRVVRRISAPSRALDALVFPVR